MSFFKYLHSDHFRILRLGLRFLQTSVKAQLKSQLTFSGQFWLTGSER